MNIAHVALPQHKWKVILPMLGLVPESYNKSTCLCTDKKIAAMQLPIIAATKRFSVNDATIEDVIASVQQNHCPSCRFGMMAVSIGDGKFEHQRFYYDTSGKMVRHMEWRIDESPDGTVHIEPILDTNPDLDPMAIWQPPSTWADWPTEAVA